MHWRIPCFYILSWYQHVPTPCCVRMSVSSNDNITLASMLLGPENASNVGHKNKIALFAEDTGGSEFGTPILGPRKQVFRGTSFHCQDLALPCSKVSPSHLSLRLLEASCTCSHTHTVYKIVLVLLAGEFPTLYILAWGKHTWFYPSGSVDRAAIVSQGFRPPIVARGAPSYPFPSRENLQAFCARIFRMRFL